MIGERIIDFLLEKNGKMGMNIAFLPYCFQMWDCMESVYQSAKARKINYSSIAQKHDYTKQNMCNRQKCIAYKDGVIVGEYLSQKDASEHTGVSKGKISSCLNGRIKSCKGYEFRRFPEREDE